MRPAWASPSLATNVQLTRQSPAVRVSPAGICASACAMAAGRRAQTAAQSGVPVNSSSGDSVMPNSARVPAPCASSRHGALSSRRRNTSTVASGWASSSASAAWPKPAASLSPTGLARADIPQEVALAVVARLAAHAPQRGGLAELQQHALLGDRRVRGQLARQRRAGRRTGRRSGNALGAGQRLGDGR